MREKLGSKRIVIATIGSLGDLHPCLALARELSRRKHRVTVTTTACYRAKVQALGVEFKPLRPDWDPTDPAIIRQCEDLKKGPEVLYRKLILPHLRDTYEDLRAAAAGCDLMIAGELVYAAPLVAEKFGLRWASAILSPFSFFSSHDPSVLVTAPSLIHLRLGGPSLYRLGLNLGKLAIRHWSNPVRSLRQVLGLTVECDPVFRDKFSRTLVLALFSPWLAQPQPDWPPSAVQPGFVDFDQDERGSDRLPELNAFLSSGAPPILFTQGSTAVHNPGEFYATSVEAAKQLGRRAVLLGAPPGPGTNSHDILSLPYAPYSRILPFAVASVHQGGSGTTGQAMRSGRPMLIVPFGWDQPDNAARIERLGVGLQIPRNKYSITTAVAALGRLLTDTNFATRAAEIAKQMEQEQGLASACDAIEACLE